MTWWHFLRTLILAMIGAAALALASHARAGGEESSLVSPQEAQAFLKTLAEQKAGVGSGEAAQIDRAVVLPVERVENAPKPRRTDGANAGALKPLIARYASENDLPYELADAVVRLESRYNAEARNGANMGLTQINFRTAQSLGYKGDAAGLLDAETNLRYGLKYLAQAYRLADGDTCGTILRYQAGHRATTMTNASRAYCAKVKVITAAAE